MATRTVPAAHRRPGGAKTSPTCPDPVRVDTTMTARMPPSAKAPAPRVKAPTRRDLDNTAHTTRHGTVRSTGNVIEDIFFTYTGCASIDEFLDLQEAGTALAESVRQGSAFTHHDVQPRVPALLETWVAHKLKTQPEARATAAPARTKPSSRRALSSYANVPKTPAVLPRLAASVTGAGDDAEAGEPESAATPNSPLLPSLEELPAIERCDEAAVRRLRTRVDAFLRRLVHLVQLTHALQDRWGLLSESERLTLHNAITGLTRSVVSRHEIVSVFTHLLFRSEGLEEVSEEMDDCEKVESLVLSNNPNLKRLQHVPPHAHTLLASVCAIEHVDFAALAFVPSLCVLGLAGNRLRDLHFLVQLPSLRVLDVSHNELADVLPVTEDICRHAALEEVTLLGNPLSLVEGYRRLVGAACPDLRTLDGFALQSREREAFTLADYTQYEQFVHAPSAPTNKKSGAEASSARRRNSQQTPRLAAAARRLDNPTANTIPPNPEVEAEMALHRQSLPTFVDLQDEYEHSVEATAEVLQISGLSSMMDQPLTISGEDELHPFSALVLEAAGLTRADDGSDYAAWRLPPSSRVAVPTLERVLSTLPGGGPPVGAATATATASVDAGHARAPRRKADGVESNAVVGSGPSSPSHHAAVATTKKGQAGKAPQRIALYETATAVTVGGTWAPPPSDAPSGEPPTHLTTTPPKAGGDAASADAVGGVRLDVRVFDSADHQVDGGAGSGLALLAAALQDSLPNLALGRRSLAADAHHEVAVPPHTSAVTAVRASVSQSAGRPGPVSKLRKAVAATAVEDTAVLNVRVVRDLPLTPDLSARLRQPVYLAVTVQDTTLVWNAEARKALLEGGGGAGVHKALQKAVSCCITAAAASSASSPNASLPTSPPRLAQGGRSSGHSSRVTAEEASDAVAVEKTALASVHTDTSSATSSTPSPAGAAADATLPLPPPLPVMQVRTYHVGGFTVYPDELLTQNPHLRPPRAQPAAATSTRAGHGAASAAGGGSGKKVAARPVLAGPAAELPCARELFLRGIPLAHSTKDAERLARDIAVAQAELCVCLEAYATVYAHAAPPRKENATSTIGNASGAAAAASGAHSPSVSLAGTLHSSSASLGNTLNGTTNSANGRGTSPQTRQRHAATGGSHGAGSANGGRRQSVKASGTEAVGPQQWQKVSEQWKAAVADRAVNVMALKARATALQSLQLQLDVCLRLGRGPAPSLPADEEARQAPVVARERTSKR